MVPQNALKNIEFLSLAILLQLKNLMLQTNNHLYGKMYIVCQNKIGCSVLLHFLQALFFECWLPFESTAVSDKKNNDVCQS